ncbi:uncharacterized protein LOC141608940 [Silene latifolia]|uniref:uncharacterized protein LOC141608940 n=1 Tax=Silene latifolia TaxID=37657 RepID=UPI003D77859F
MGETKPEFSLATLKDDINSLHDLLKTQFDPLILTTKLYDAAIRGDLNSLHNLLSQDPFILDRCIIEKSDRFMQSPLHVAASLGHLEFTTEILSQKPELAKQLDQSTRSSALHLASEKGHLNVVMKLLEVMPNMCFARDQEGRNPVHVAAINNQFHVLEFLVLTNPSAAQERTNAHETILHLCVKYAKLETLKYLLDVIGELLNAKDNDGNTVLHLAVIANQPETVKLLVNNKRIQQNAINKDGLTAIDCLIRAEENPDDNDNIRRTLKRAKTMKAKYVEKHEKKDVKWLEKQRTSLMVVASLIATMAFTFGINPSWGPESSPDVPPTSDVNFDIIVGINTVGFVSSLSVVILLIGGLPCKRFFVVILMITMWVSISATLLTYMLALENPSNPPLGHSVDNTIVYSLKVWIILVAILLLGNIARLLFKPAKKLLRLVKKMWCEYVLKHEPVIGMNSLSSVRNDTP